MTPVPAPGPGLLAGKTVLITGVSGKPGVIQSPGPELPTNLRASPLSAKGLIAVIASARSSGRTAVPDQDSGKLNCTVVRARRQGSSRSTLGPV